VLGAAATSVSASSRPGRSLSLLIGVATSPDVMLRHAARPVVHRASCAEHYDFPSERVLLGLVLDNGAGQSFCSPRHECAATRNAGTQMRAGYIPDLSLLTCIPGSNATYEQVNHVYRAQFRSALKSALCNPTSCVEELRRCDPRFDRDLWNTSNAAISRPRQSAWETQGTQIRVRIRTA
jgi:hypothetical protein